VIPVIVLVIVASVVLYLSPDALDFCLNKTKLSKWNSSNAPATEFIRIALLIVFVLTMADLQLWLGLTGIVLYLARNANRQS
jgi:uncharacterized membrane protein YecN with MAPEG domain